MRSGPKSGKKKLVESSWAKTLYFASGRAGPGTKFLFLLWAESGTGQGLKNRPVQTSNFALYVRFYTHFIVY